MKRVLITDECHRLLLDGLERIGLKCDFSPTISPKEVFDMIHQYYGVIVNSKVLVDREFLDAAVQLRFVGRLGSGMEIIDQEYAAQKGVAVVSSPEGNTNAVAEHALGMLLALMNNLVRADRQTRENLWRRELNRGAELAGRTIGIIGFGHTGSQFARKLAGMEMTILAYDKYKTDYCVSMPWVREADLETIVQQADIISLHLPLTDETRHFVNKAFLKRCKPGLILINTARGACVKTKDLVLALESGRVGGACLDVFENEKPTTYSASETSLYDRLYAMDNVVISPHIAGWTHESKRKLAEVLLEKIIAVLYPPKFA
ncbi:MAG: NAD(P)-dependent oxidoreductase [Saprospiraceae bacterium]